jgi:hypothetical protein
MSEITTPSNPNIPPQTPIPGNVASLTNPSTLSNLKNSVSPKTFGDQAKNIAKATVIKAATESTIAGLYKEKANLIQEGIQLDLDHQINLQKLEQDTVPAKKIVNGETVDIPPKLTQEEYERAVAIENANYEVAKKNLQERKDKNQKDIDDYLKDPFKKQKDQFKKIKDRLKKRKNKNKADKTKSRKALSKSVLQNARKSLVPILTLLLTNKIAEVIAQNDKIGKLVDDTNAIIIDANESGDPTKLNNAKLARDNAIRIIQSNIDKITQIKNQIQRIQTYISIFSIIVNIISTIPIPTSVPPGVGIPVSLIMKFVNILDKANRIILELSALLPIASNTLQKAIDILQDYRSQLLNINGQLETAAATENSSLIDNPNQFGTDLGIYKGFKFALREESGPRALVVRGNKRHYAEAIDTNNVAVLKSELSFTLDPNDLIDQLKLIIDSQNLIA